MKGMLLRQTANFVINRSTLSKTLVPMPGIGLMMIDSSNISTTNGTTGVVTVQKAIFSLILGLIFIFSKGT